MLDWHGLDPSDGLTVTLDVRSDAACRVASVRIDLFIERLLVATSTIVEIKNPTPTDIGELKRRCIVYEAAAEYLNAGGDVSIFPDLFPDSLQQRVWSLKTEGWSYFDTGLTEDGKRIHEFVSADGSRFVRWVRGEYIDADMPFEVFRDGEADETGIAENLSLEGHEAAGEASEGILALPE